jgi:hypothetical protein
VCPVLTSWKEIAVYLSKGVRTVQRWERLGLPVHRPSVDAHIIIAFPAEIEEWLRKTPVASSGELGRLQSRLSELESENEQLRQQIAELTGRVPLDARDRVQPQGLKLDRICVQRADLNASGAGFLKRSRPLRKMAQAG